LSRGSSPRRNCPRVRSRQSSRRPASMAIVMISASGFWSSRARRAREVEVVGMVAWFRPLRRPSLRESLADLPGPSRSHPSGRRA